MVGFATSAVRAPMSDFSIGPISPAASLGDAFQFVGGSIW